MRISDWSSDVFSTDLASVLVKVREFFQGGSELLPLNPEWDRWVIDRFSAADLASLASLTTPGVVADVGRGGQEVRTWLAAFATLARVGPYEVTPSFYAPAEEWLVGMGVMAARDRKSQRL